MFLRYRMRRDYGKGFATGRAGNRPRTFYVSRNPTPRYLAWAYAAGYADGQHRRASDG
jgi:hypothetical protein